MNASVSRWFLSMPACTLNTTPEKSSPTSRCSSIAVVDASTAFGSEARPSGAGAMAHSVSRIWCTPKFSIAEAKMIGEVMHCSKSCWSCTAPSSSRSSASSTAVSHTSPSRSAASAGV